MADVGIIMGSRSDWETMRHAAEILDALVVGYETRIVSAHRTPERLYDYARTAAERGLKVIIAGAGGAAVCAPAGAWQKRRARTASEAATRRPATTCNICLA